MVSGQGVKTQDQEYDSDHSQQIADDHCRTTPRLTYSFLHVANLDSSVFERLNRYEATLWRQALQIIFALQPIKQR